MARIDHSYASERELLYKILYELRGNVSDLRREMNSLRKQLDEARQLGAYRRICFSGSAEYPGSSSIICISGFIGFSRYLPYLRLPISTSYNTSVRK